MTASLRTLLVAGICAAFVPFSAYAQGTQPGDTVYARKGWELIFHPDLSAYTDVSKDTRYSHVCGTAPGLKGAIGTYTGTVVFDFSDTTLTPGDLTFFPGAPGHWRECRVHTNKTTSRTYVYVVTEGVNDKGKPTLTNAHPGGIQVIDITDAVPRFVGVIESPHFNSAHTITIDSERELAFVNGSGWRFWKDKKGPVHEPQYHLHLGGMRIIDISNPDPLVVKDLGGFGDTRLWMKDYTHDSYHLGAAQCADGTTRDIAYSASIYTGELITLDVANPDNPAVLNRQTTPLTKNDSVNNVTAHNVWASPDGRWLYLTEETKGSGLVVYDLANPCRPAYVTLYRSAAVHDSSTAHNVVVPPGTTAYVAWYTDGMREIDITDPRNPKEVGYFDTSLLQPVDKNKKKSATAHLQGAWSVWPTASRLTLQRGSSDFGPRTCVLISDMQNGLFFVCKVETAP